MKFIVVVLGYVLVWKLYQTITLGRNGGRLFTQSDKRWRQERVVLSALTAVMAVVVSLWCSRWQAVLAGSWLLLVVWGDVRELWLARKLRLFNLSHPHIGPPPASPKDPPKTATHNHVAHGTIG